MGKDIEDMVSTFLDERLRRAVAKVDALTTESTADERQATPPAGRRGGGIPWEVIAGRDDKNKDGKVTREEFSGPAPFFQRLDRNGDGVITREEHQSAIPPSLRK